LLTDAVDEQNKTLEIIANSKAHSCQELWTELTDSVNRLEKTNTTTKRQLKDLELEQEKLKKAV
jgi:hypothetical protein